MKSCLLIFIVILLSVPSNYSQGKPDIKFGADDPFDLQEVGAYIVRDKDKFKVQFVAPENRRLNGYQNVDLKKDDIIMTVNGKAVKKLSDLRETYDKLKIGKDFKLEIKRGGKLIAVSLKKVDPKYLPPKRVARINNAGWMKDKVFLHGCGVQIGKINEKPMIEKIHGDNDLVKQAGLKGGDLVTSINGQAVKTFVQFKEIYDNIQPKQDVNIKFGNKYISFKKSEFKGTDEPTGAQFR